MSIEKINDIIYCQFSEFRLQSGHDQFYISVQRISKEGMMLSNAPFPYLSKRNCAKLGSEGYNIQMVAVPLYPCQGCGPNISFIKTDCSCLTIVQVRQGQTISGYTSLRTEN